MSDEKKSPAIFVVEPTLPVITSVLEVLRGNRREPIEMFSSAQEAVARIAGDEVPCVLIFSIRQEEDFTRGLQLVKSLLPYRTAVPYKILVVTRIDNFKLRHAYQSMGVSEFLNEKTPARSLAFKVSFLLNQLVNQLAKSTDEKMIRGGRSATANDKVTVAGGNVQVSDQILADDVWLIRGVAPRKVGVQWVIESEGPDPDSGNWEALGQSDDRQEQWIWRPEVEHESETSTPSPSAGDGWVFKGNKPSFDAETGKWKFVAAKPNLSSRRGGQATGQKIKFEDKEITLASDNPAAEGRIAESRRLAEKVRARRQRELAAKAEREHRARQEATPSSGGPSAEAEGTLEPRDDAKLGPEARARRAAEWAARAEGASDDEVAARGAAAALAERSRLNAEAEETARRERDARDVAKAQARAAREAETRSAREAGERDSKERDSEDRDAEERGSEERDSKERDSGSHHSEDRDRPREARDPVHSNAAGPTPGGPHAPSDLGPPRDLIPPRGPDAPSNADSPAPSPSAPNVARRRAEGAGPAVGAPTSGEESSRAGGEASRNGRDDSAPADSAANPAVAASPGLGHGGATGVALARGPITFKRVDGVVRSTKRAVPLVRLPNVTLGSEKGLWEKVGDQGWIYVTPEMRSRGADSILAASPLFYLDRTAHARAPLFDAHAWAWLFAEDHRPVEVTTFPDLPLPYQNYLVDAGAAPVDFDQARDQMGDRLQELHRDTWAEFERFDEVDEARGGQKKISHLKFLLALSDLNAAQRPRPEVLDAILLYLQTTFELDEAVAVRAVAGSSGALVLGSSRPERGRGGPFAPEHPSLATVTAQTSAQMFTAGEADVIATFPIAANARPPVGSLILFFPAARKSLILSQATFIEQMRAQITRLLIPLK